MSLSGQDVDIDPEGRQIQDSDFILTVNAGPDAVQFGLPRDQAERPWRCILNTAQPAVTPEVPCALSGDCLEIPGRCLMLWEAKRSDLSKESH